MMLDDSNRQLAEHKLILLYIIEHVDTPLNNIEIMQFVLENNLMNYFMFQNTINELCDNKLLICTVLDNKTYYSLTSEGKTTLEYFNNLIPQGIRSRIDDLFRSKKEIAKLDSLILSDYKKNNTDYTVYCTVNQELFNLVDFKLNVSDESIAQTICSNWKKFFPEIYPEIIEILMRNRG